MRPDSNQDPLVSVIVPTFSRPRALRECVAALALQSLPEGRFEIVVVDDGSPPASNPEPLPAVAGLRVIRQANAGPAAARNAGAREARGSILAFTDDDCRPSPAWLSTLLGPLADRRDLLVGTLTWNALSGSPCAHASQRIVDLVYEHFNRDPAKAYFLTSNNCACHRESFLEAGGFDTTFPQAGAEDREFCDRWRMLGRPIRLVCEPLVAHYHEQGVREFWSICHRYGRGAYHYQALRQRRGSGTIKEDLGFHQRLLKELPGILAKEPGPAARLRLLSLLAMWQVANATGFFRAAWENQWNRQRARGVV